MNVPATLLTTAILAACEGSSGVIGEAPAIWASQSTRGPCRAPARPTPLSQPASLVPPAHPFMSAGSEALPQAMHIPKPPAASDASSLFQPLLDPCHARTVKPVPTRCNLLATRGKREHQAAV